jgi:hypothetical protein
VNRRTALKALGVAPLAVIPTGVDAARETPTPMLAVSTPQPAYAAIATAPDGNRVAGFAISSAMAFFHGVMADDHVPLEQRMEAAENLMGAGFAISGNLIHRNEGITY